LKVKVNHGSHRLREDFTDEKGLTEIMVGWKQFQVMEAKDGKKRFII
jgi:hypothetical protein